MVIGIPKEIKTGENRVAVTPAGVHTLVGKGHLVLIEKNAGQGSGFTDEEYRLQGAEVVASNEEVFNRSELIAKVKEPLGNELTLLREDQILFTYLHLAASQELTGVLLSRKVTAVAYETVQDGTGKLPLLLPMSEVAGRMSIQVAMRYLETDYGGKGILLSGVPGVAPAEVVILGCGVVGLNAARMATGLGARVTIFDISHDRLKFVDDSMQGRIATVYPTPGAIEEAVSHTDVLVGAVLITGARAPILVTEAMISRMKPGGVIIDVSVDQGGCIETIRPTTSEEPVYKLHGVIHYGVPNIPGAVPRTSTYALANATLPYLSAIASKGIQRAAHDDELLARGINCAKGILTHSAVAASLKTQWKPWDQVL